MAINSVSFGAEQERQKQGSGILIPTVGLLGGGVTGVALNMRKPEMTEDTFTSSLKDNKEIKFSSSLTADEQKLVDEAKKEFANNSSTPVATSEAKPQVETATPKPENTTPSVSSKKSLVSEFTTEEIFNGNAELAPKEYLQRKYGFNTVEELQDRLKQTNLFGEEAEALKKGVKIGKDKEQLVEILNKQNVKKFALESEIANLELKIKEETYKLDQVKSDAKGFKNVQNKIDAFNKNLYVKNELLDGLSTDIKDLEKKIGKNKINDLQDQSVLKENIEVKKSKANIEQAKKTAKNEFIAEIEKEVKKQAYKEDIPKINKDRAKLNPPSEAEINDYVAKAKIEAAKAHQDKIAGLQKSLDEINNDGGIPNTLNEKGKEAELQKYKDSRQAKINEIEASLKAEKAIDVEKEIARKAEIKIRNRNLPMNKNEVDDFIKKAKEKALTLEANKQKIANAEELAAARTYNEIVKNETSKFLSSTSKRLKQESKKWVSDQRKFEKMTVTRQELADDLKMVQNARKNNTKITAKLAEEVIPAHGKVSEGVAKAAGKAAETVSNITETAKKAVSKAYEAVKAKLPKNDFKSSWKQGAIFGAIGLGAGLVIKLITDGSSDKSAE